MEKVNTPAAAMINVRSFIHRFICQTKATRAQDGNSKAKQAMNAV
jgi:hypothetical protein